MSQPVQQPPDDWIINPDATDTPVKPQEAAKMRIGFTVGVLEGSEELVFRVHGEKPGLVELAGLVKYADEMVKASLHKVTPLTEEDKLMLQSLQQIRKDLEVLKGKAG